MHFYLTFTFQSMPSVFISYQWGKQKQIKILYQRLTSLGYHCWLDINQMGGGDSLYDKIDKGVRGCKVMVSCVTTKYSLSANCRREVSLADALKKPIIPLLLEQMTWPPEGPMSMPFTQLLYVDFCKPNVEIQNHWNVPEFKDLLSKIETHISAKDVSAIKENKSDNNFQKCTKSSHGQNTEDISQKTSQSNTEVKRKHSKDNKGSLSQPVLVTVNHKKSSACAIL